ncbi:MAG: prolipoprotein diacylglyceryl transferase family protein [Polyangiaceae bacterium]
MSAPLIPYITIPEIPIIPAISLGGRELAAITIKPFGTLVALGVYFGWKLAARQANRLGLNAEVFNQFIVWILTGGFVGGHVFDVLLYHPWKLAEGSLIDAITELAFIWRSPELIRRIHGAGNSGSDRLKYRFKASKEGHAVCGHCGSAFPLGWVFGRSGCSVAHDHPGMRSDAWFAVQYPHGGRFDLGLYEMLLTIPLALTFFYLMKKPRPFGFYIGVMCMVYAPTRFALDFLRAIDVADADPRHFGLTPAQWLCTALLGLGVFMFLRSVRAAERGETPHYVDEKTAKEPVEEAPATQP